MTLTDCNDNTPVFGSDGRYTVTVADGSMPAANPIYTGITVNDLDSTVAFQTITYAIDGGTAQTNNWINIDSSTVRGWVYYFTIFTNYSKWIALVYDLP